MLGIKPRSAVCKACYDSSPSPIILVWRRISSCITAGSLRRGVKYILLSMTMSGFWWSHKSYVYGAGPEETINAIGLDIRGETGTELKKKGQKMWDESLGFRRRGEKGEFKI